MTNQSDEMVTSIRKTSDFHLSHQTVSSSQNRQGLFFLCVSLRPAHCMTQNRQLNNVCWMNNPEEEVEDNSPSSCLLSSDLTLFLNVDKADRGSCKELWVMGLTTGPPLCKQHGPHAMKLPRSTNPSGCKFRNTSFQRVEFLAFSPSCLLTTH